MTFPQAIILAIVQGLTEFLPVSSSGHLVIFQNLFGLAPPVFFDVAVHVGTLGAILVYFRKELISPIQLTRLTKPILVGTLPAAVVGLVLQSRIEEIFSSLPLVGVSLLITAGLLFSTRRTNNSEVIAADLPAKHTGSVRMCSPGVDSSGKKISLEWKGISVTSSLLVGFAQALAILPGISRSGATIVTGLHRGLSRQTAFRFSFFLAIPAILGALVLQLPDLIGGHFSQLNYAALGAFIAGVVGYFSLKALEKVLLKAKLWWFGVYCLFLSLTTIIMSI